MADEGRPGDGRRREFRPVSRPDRPPAATDLRAMSPGRRWRLRRDLVIFLASRQGASLRMLADVFDLPHSRISAILKNMRGRYESGA